MVFGLKRSDLKALAVSKIEDATHLISIGSYSNGYYLAGYSIELALKACIARQIAAETIPDKAFINSVYVHNLKSLIGSAGLNAALKEAEDKDPNFAANWAIVSEWTPEVRYETIEAFSAQLLSSAITDPKSGVLQWIKAHW
jgi:hypothetical protein